MGINMWEDVKKDKFDKKYGLTEDDCKRAARHMVKAIKAVCPGPLESMEYFIKLVEHELGVYIWVDSDGVNKTNLRAKIRKRRLELIRTERSIDDKGQNRRLTDIEMDELNDVSKELLTLKSQLVRGNESLGLSWITPSGFKVESTHRSRFQLTVIGNIQDVREDKNGDLQSNIGHVLWIDGDRPDITKTVSAISPNIVHSYDAAHLAMIAAQWHGSLGVIHDSFSTHACDVPDLIHIIKQTFSEIYEDKNIFEYLRAQILTDDDQFDTPTPIPGRMDFDKLRQSDFFFN